MIYLKILTYKKKNRPNCLLVDLNNKLDIFSKFKNVC